MLRSCAILIQDIVPTPDITLMATDNASSADVHVRMHYGRVAKTYCPFCANGLRPIGQAIKPYSTSCKSSGCYRKHLTQVDSAKQTSSANMSKASPCLIRLTLQFTIRTSSTQEGIGLCLNLLNDILNGRKGSSTRAGLTQV